MTNFKGWCAWFGFQLLSAVLTVIGWFVLLPMAVAWRVTMLGNNWRWFNAVYGNAENGVDPGAQLVVNGLTQYMPWAPQWLRVYMWTAWRNSCNNLRWTFSHKGGPWLQVRRWGWYFQAGYRPDTGWPVWSAGRGDGTKLP